jgi:hypothetical protein
LESYLEGWGVRRLEVTRVLELATGGLENRKFSKWPTLAGWLMPRLWWPTFFDSLERFVRAVGREGGGPGEFEHEILAPMRRPSDAHYERAIELLLERFTAGEVRGYVALPEKSRVLEIGVDYFIVLDSGEAKTAVALYRYARAATRSPRTTYQ